MLFSTSTNSGHAILISVLDDSPSRFEFTLNWIVAGDASFTSASTDNEVVVEDGQIIHLMVSETSAYFGNTFGLFVSQVIGGPPALLVGEFSGSEYSFTYGSGRFVYTMNKPQSVPEYCSSFILLVLALVTLYRSGRNLGLSPRSAQME